MGGCSGTWGVWGSHQLGEPVGSPLRPAQLQAESVLTLQMHIPNKKRNFPEIFGGYFRRRWLAGPPALGPETSGEDLSLGAWELARWPVSKVGSQGQGLVPKDQSTVLLLISDQKWSRPWTGATSFHVCRQKEEQRPCVLAKEPLSPEPQQTSTPTAAEFQTGVPVPQPRDPRPAQGLGRLRTAMAWHFPWASPRLLGLCPTKSLCVELSVFGAYVGTPGEGNTGSWVKLNLQL